MYSYEYFAGIKLRDQQGIARFSAVSIRSRPVRAGNSQLVLRGISSTFQCTFCKDLRVLLLVVSSWAYLTSTKYCQWLSSLFATQMVPPNCQGDIYEYFVRTHSSRGPSSQNGESRAAA